MTASQDSADTLSALQAAIEYGDDRRSPLFRWMLKHYDPFAELLQSARLTGSRPNWSRLANTFSQHGFLNADGAPLNKRVVRTTWYRVRKARGSLPSPAVLAPSPPPVRPVTVQPSQFLQETSVRGQDNNEALADMLAEMNKRSGRI
jgi:hypothetical protein